MKGFLVACLLGFLGMTIFWVVLFVLLSATGRI
jgi:hypothetical protein